MLVLLATLLFLVGPDWASAQNLLFEDNFDTLDEGKWQHLVTAWRGGNAEFQYYRNNRKNSYVRDGILYIKPSLTADEFGEDFLYHGTLDLNPDGCNIPDEGGCLVSGGDEIINPVQSARIRTINSFNFVYGRVEVSAQAARGDWLWPAIWLLPTDMAYGVWPASGEIDLMEIRGNRDLRDPGGQAQGIQRQQSTLHFGPRWPYDGWGFAHWEKSLEGTGRDYGDGFHTYVLDWTPTGLTFTVDGELLGATNLPAGGFWELGGYNNDPGGDNPWAGGALVAPFDKPFHLIINLAVGGGFFPGGWTNAPNPYAWDWNQPFIMKQFWENRGWWQSTWNQDTEEGAMKIDYIRVYAP